MKKKEKKTYTDFLNSNIDLIKKELTKISYEMGKLEHDYKPIKEYYIKLNSLTDNLSKILANFTSLQGEENLQKIRTLIKKNKQSIENQSFDFKTINMLIKKTEKFIMEENILPKYDIKKIKIEESFFEKTTKKYNNYPFKWISFFKSGSWFMLNFSSLEIKDSSDFKLTYQKTSNKIIATNTTQSFHILDPFSELAEIDEIPEKIIFIDSKKIGIAAKKIGKIIHSKNNFISEITTDLDKEINTDFIKGRVKIFGKNHLLINSFD